MNLIIHAEIEGADELSIYEGDSVEEAKTFMEDLTDVVVLQCNLYSKKNGEARALARVAKGEGVDALAEDINAWLEENV